MRILLVHERTVGTHDDHRDAHRGDVALELAQHFQARLGRQRQVQQNRVRQVLECPLETFLPIFRFDYREPLTRK